MTMEQRVDVAGDRLEIEREAEIEFSNKSKFVEILYKRRYVKSKEVWGKIIKSDCSNVAQRLLLDVDHFVNYRFSILVDFKSSHSSK